MSKLVYTFPSESYIVLIGPVVIAGVLSILLLMAHFQPIHYFLMINVCAISSLFAGKFLRKVSVKSLVKRSLMIVTCLLLLAVGILPSRAAVITECSMFGGPRPRGIMVAWVICLVLIGIAGLLLASTLMMIATAAFVLLTLGLSATGAAALIARKLT